MNDDDHFVRLSGRWLIARSVSQSLSMMVSEVGEDALARIRIAARSDIAGDTPLQR